MRRNKSYLIASVFCVVALAPILCPGITFGATIHVPGDYSTIQAGIDAAAVGDTVLVTDGTYTGQGNRDLDFEGKAITVQSENGPNNCIINCEGSWDAERQGFYFHSGETNSSVVRGLTIRNGYWW